MVGPDPQPIGEDLRRGMAVAEMPGEPRECPGILGHDLDDGLLGGAHDESPAVLEDEPVALVQMPRLGQVEQDGLPRIGAQRHPPPMAVVVSERDAPRRLSPRLDRDRPDHPRTVQKRKRRCAIGRTAAGSQVWRTPSARTS